jgi:hypothetical protein
VAVQWYYSRDGERYGPLTGEQLKQMAGTGELQPADLVWNETLSDWVPATRIKGLFPKAGSPSQSSPSQLGAAPPTGAPPQAAPAGPQVAATDPVHERIQASSGHVLDGLLSAAGDLFNAAILRSMSTGLVMLGGFVLLGCVVLNLVLKIMDAAKFEQYSLILPALSTALLLVGLQYVGSKLCPRIRELIESTPSTIASTTFLNCLAIVLLSFGFVFLVNFMVNGIRGEVWGLISLGIALFVIFEFAAGITLHPRVMSIEVRKQNIPAGEEALQILYFLMKLLAQVIPVVYGMMILVGAERLVWALIYFLKENAYQYGFADRQASFYLMLGGLTPLVGYVYFVVYHLVIDIMRALLSLPGKLDVLADIGRGGDS